MNPISLARKLCHTSPSALGVALRRRIDFAVKAVRAEHCLRDCDNLQFDPDVLSYCSTRPLTKEMLSSIRWQNEMYRTHVFNFCGSGWRKNELNGECSLPAHCKDFSESLLKKLPPDYRRLNWHKDLKSGYQWRSDVYAKKALRTIGLVPGCDIKMPWELARFQHLPRLALEAWADETTAGKNIAEICHEIIDFFAMNPMDIGVNWSCPMETGIRIANILLAVDILNSSEHSRNIFAQYGLGDVLVSCVWQHGKSITENLEYYRGSMAGNHYLADICGLFIAALHLESTAETDRWLAFSLQELIRMVRLQYHSDGGHFEASSSYHRLCSEMVVYTTAYALGISRERLKMLSRVPCGKLAGFSHSPELQAEQDYETGEDGIIFPPWYTERICQMLKYTKHLTAPDGSIVQFGDNDSGRFFTLSAFGEMLTAKQAEVMYANLDGYGRTHAPEDLYWNEHELNHSGFLQAGKALFSCEQSETLESFCVSLVSRNRKLKLAEVTSLADTEQNSGKMPDLPYQYPVYFHAKEDESPVLWKQGAWCFSSQPGKVPAKSFLAGMRKESFPVSGVFLLRSERIFLAAVCPPPSEDGAHSHNDKLSIVLYVDGSPVIRDPGSWQYTAKPEERDQYRTDAAHLFWLPEDGTKQSLLPVTFMSQWKRFSVKSYSAENGWNLFADFGYYQRSLSVRVCEHEIILQTGSSVPLKQNMDFATLPFSDGYGKRLN